MVAREICELVILCIKKKTMVAKVTGALVIFCMAETMAFKVIIELVL